jgi:hypothetical protein
LTVIAYRNGIMAGDSCWSEADGLIINSQNKLIRLPSGALYGGAGAPDDRALLGLLCDVEERTRLPDWTTLQGANYEELEALLVLPDESVWSINGGAKGYGVCPVSLPYIAIGAGAAVAIGALAAGATAKRAVDLACRHNTFCRPPVHTLTL